MSRHINLTRIKALNNVLKALGYNYAFVGGAAVSLYAHTQADEVRQTDDVDVLVEVYSRLEYAKLEDKLRTAGFVNDTSAAFIGRFLIQGLVVDIMPLE